MSSIFSRRWPWSRTPEPPDAWSFAPASILLASEGRRIPAEAIEFAINLARKAQAPVHVLIIARIWGSAFGLPHPGLMPNKREWQTQRDLAADAVDQLKRAGVEATGSVISSRNAAKRIIAEAKRRRLEAIVMAAPPPQPWIVANFLWEHEPYRVRRLSERPVYLVRTGPTPSSTSHSTSPRDGGNNTSSRLSQPEGVFLTRKLYSPQLTNAPFWPHTNRSESERGK